MQMRKKKITDEVLFNFYELISIELGDRYMVALYTCTIFSTFIIFFFFCCAGDGTQDLMQQGKHSTTESQPSPITIFMQRKNFS
jgi:hypothetical protein